MAVSDRQQLSMHLNKWIVTISEGKGLTKGDQRDFFFRKLNPFCELSLGDQGPYPTSIKSNTTQPVWDDSIEFEATTSPSSHPSQVPPQSSRESDYGDERPAGPKLNVVCFTRSSIKAPEATREATGCSKVEIGRAEIELGSSKTGKVVAPLWRLSDDDCQVPVGNVTVEYTFVEGIPRRHRALPTEESADRERAMDGPAPDSPGDTSNTTNSINGSSSRNPRRFGFLMRICTGGSLSNLCGDRLERFLDGSYRKPAILVAFSAMIVAFLTAHFASLQSSPKPALTPIAVPFEISAGKSKGSVTHHVRLHAEDGNVVIARGRKPSTDSGVPATTPTKAGVLWESGPIRSLERSRYPFMTACRRCKLHVNKDGLMAVVRGKEKLAVFSPSTVKYLDSIFTLDGGND